MSEDTRSPNEKACDAANSIEWHVEDRYNEVDVYQRAIVTNTAVIGELLGLIFDALGKQDA